MLMTMMTTSQRLDVGDNDNDLYRFALEDDRWIL